MASSRRTWLVLILVALGTLGMMALVLVGIAMPSSNEWDSVTMSRLEACPDAVELLGKPMTNQVWGFGGAGTVRLRGAFGEVDRADLVRGSKASGTYHYVLEKRGGPWQMLNATLVVGDKQVDVAKCTARVVR